MILISHRGNVNGPIKEAENNPEYIKDAIRLGYDVEVDVWYIDGQYFLGHDKPQYKTSLMFLENPQLWIHAKNPAVLTALRFTKAHYFWHEYDTVALTSKGYIWAYPGKQPIENSIAVMPELYNESVLSCVGVCSDYIENYKQTNYYE